MKINRQPQAGTEKIQDSFYRKNILTERAERIMNTLKEEIHAYWTQRAEGYSEYNQQEMADARRSMWKNKLLSLLEENFPGKNPEELKVLDVGTGPGFFALLLAEAGYQVTAADVTEEMLKEAKKNTGVFAEKITWKLSDAQKLELGDCEFDAVFSRNVTWNLENPGQAYEEWVRVLKPGGLLCNFDADWYGHLYDEEKRSGYEKDRQRVEEKNLEDYYTGHCQTGSFKQTEASSVGCGSPEKCRADRSKLRHRGVETGMDRRRDRK